MSAFGPAGFYGKIPRVGDFIRARLPVAFVDPWHAAMQGLLVELQRTPVARTTQCPWRFILAPGVCGSQAWVGVMAFSQDRVGRSFPLVLAAAWDGCAAEGCAGWFSQGGSILTAAVANGLSVRQLDSACIEIAPARMPPDDQPPDPIVDALVAEGAAAVRGGIWWAFNGGGVVAHCLTTPGLPQPQHAHALAGGGAQSSRQVLDEEGP